MAQIALYSYFRSSSAYRVRLALNLKGVKYDYRPIHLLQNGGDQYSADYRKINAMGQVPALVVGDQTLTQSMAIIDFLDREFPQPPLFPMAAMERARVIEMCEIINSGIQPLQNLSVLQKLIRQMGLSEEEKIQWGQEAIERGFQALEARLKQFSGTYSFGESVTAADLFLVPQVYNAHRFNVNMQKFPKMTQVNENCLKLEAFQQAQPENQPDAPGK